MNRNDEGIVFDDMYEMDAWENKNVKQKNIIDDLHEFVEEYEEELKKHEELN